MSETINESIIEIEIKEIYVSGTNEKKIIAATNWSEGRGGLEYPSRYVVLEWGEGNYHKYSRHMQVNDGEHDDYFIYGHYYSFMEDAMNDMIISMNDNNKNYPLGNISHMPGIDASFG